MKRILLPMTAIAACAISASSFSSDATTVSTTALSAQVKKLSAQTKKLEHEMWLLKHKKSHTVSTAGHHFVTVTTTPFMNKEAAYDGSDLLYNVSSMNEDLRLLEQKKDLINHGESLHRPILQLSGSVQAQASSISGFGTKTIDGVSLSTAELDMNAIASSWASAFMSMEFSGGPTSLGNRAPNSTIYLGRAFATFGNLEKCPVYFSGGLMYVPFGRYANGMVSTPLTQSMGRIRTPAALLGFSLDNGLFGSVYGFSGSQTSGSSGDVFKQYGVNAGFKNTFDDKGHYSVGAGWVSNFADTQGQQNTGLGSGTTQFSGFAVSTSTSTNNNLLVHRVGAIDGHGQVVYHRLTLIGEYLTAARRYAAADLTYHGTGAEPSAMHAEVDYLLPWFAKKYSTALGVSYGHTWQALALNLPQDSYATFLNTSIWRETTESIEYRHDTDYASSAFASGRGATTNITGTGKGRNSVILQFGVYF